LVLRPGLTQNNAQDTKKMKKAYKRRDAKRANVGQLKDLKNAQKSAGSDKLYNIGDLVPEHNQRF